MFIIFVVSIDMGFQSVWVCLCDTATPNVVIWHYSRTTSITLENLHHFTFWFILWCTFQFCIWHYTIPAPHWRFLLYHLGPLLKLVLELVFKLNKLNNPVSTSFIKPLTFISHCNIYYIHNPLLQCEYYYCVFQQVHTSLYHRFWYSVK